MGGIAVVCALPRHCHPRKTDMPESTLDVGPTPKRLPESAHRALKDGETYEPYVPASAAPDEFTI
jgi:hypothetical protein